MKELIVFGEDWGRHPSSSQHIINTIADQFDVQWVNSIGLRKPGINARDFKRIAEKAVQRFGQKTQSHTTVSAPFPVIKPLVWPLAENRAIKQLNRLSLSQQLPKKAAFRVAWLALPSAVDYLDTIDADLVVYYCGDDFSGLAGVDHQRVAQCEKVLAERADLIFCASPAMATRFPANKTHIVSHGVDFNLFSEPTANPYPESDSRSKIGFYGSLNNWLDQALLVELANARKQIDFYLIGRQDCDVSALNHCDNVIMRPAVPHHELAQYVQHWDAALLPFVDNEQIRACNPLKLREYMAAGCPVISSDFPAAHQYPCHVSIANNIAEWLEAIDAFCLLNNQHRLQFKKMAQQKMKSESWQRRGQQAISLINNKIEENKAPLSNLCTS